MSEIFSKILKDKNGKVLNVGSKYRQPEWGSEENGVILPEMTLEVDPDAGMAVVTSPLNAPVINGEVYNVIFNGVEYPCTAVESSKSQGFVLGDGSILGVETPNAGTPFILIVSFDVVAQTSGMYLALVPLDGSALVNIAIKGTVSHKIPTDYLDSGIFNFLVDLRASGTFPLETDFSEILSAVNSGKKVCATDGTNILSLLSHSDRGMEFFTPVGFAERGTLLVFVSVSIDNTYKVTKANISYELIS